MAYSDVITSGLGELEYYMAIEGCGYVFGTYTEERADAWYAGKGYTYHQGLRAGSIKRKCGARPGEVFPDLSGMDVEIDDPDEVLAAYLRHVDGCGTAELTATLTAAGATINVNGTAALPGVNSVVHIDREAIKYGTKNAADLTTLTRAWHGSVASLHTFSEDSFPSCRPVVSDGPGSLRGRRVVIYVAHHTDSGLSATSQIWVGVVDGEHTFDGKVLRIPVAHGLGLYANGTAFGAPPIARLRGLYIPNVSGLRWGRLSVDDPNNGLQTVDLVTDGDATLYDSGQEVASAFIEAFNAAVTDWSAGQLPDGRVYLVCNGVAPGGSYTLPKIAGGTYGLLQSILGFVADEGASGATFAERDFDDRIVAARAPAKVFAVLHTWGGFETRLYMEDGEASLGWVASGIKIETAALDYYGIIHSVSTANDYLVASPDYSFGSGEPWASEIMVFGDEASGPVLRQVWLLDNFFIHDVCRGLWDGTLYTGSSWGYTLPDRWLPEPCLRDGDVDWAELRALVTSAPAAAARIYAVVEEPTALRDLILGPLLACGIYATVKEDGTVGWQRTALPSTAMADVTITGAYIDADEVEGIAYEPSRERVVNCCRFLLETAARRGDGISEKKILVVDNQSIQRYGARPVRVVSDLGDVTEEIKLRVASALITDSLSIGHELARHMAGPLRLLGSGLPHVELPVTVRARSLEIGDAVLLTSDWVRSPTTGLLGVTAQLCLVMGWERAEGYDERAVDRIDLWLVTRPTPAISPAALCDSWDNAESCEFSVDTLFKRSGDVSDLSYFEAGDVVEFVEYDATVPDIATATILSVNVAGKEVTLTAAPAGTMTTPCIMRFHDWTSCTADQQGEGWAWICDADDGLIDDDGDGGRWG